MSNSGSDGEPKYDFNPYKLPNEYLRAVGLVIACASQTESILQNFIGAVLKIDLIETRALTAHMSMPLKDDIARALAELSAPTASELDAIDDILDGVWDAMQKRNTLAHNAIIRRVETGEILSWREQARGSFSGKLTPIQSEEIERDAEVIYQAGMALQGFMIERNLHPLDRDTLPRVPIKRTKKAREARRNPDKE